MTPKQRAAYQAALDRLERETLAAGPAKLEPARTDAAPAGVDEDAQPLTEMLQAISSRRNAERAALLARVRKAQQKLKSAPKTYGLCEECEEPIPAARLQAVPYAPLCATCQAERDPKRGEGRRSLTSFV
jgi:DnaK suppressor protein